MDSPEPGYGPIVHEARLAFNATLEHPRGIGPWEVRAPVQRELDNLIGETVAKAERDRIITLLQAHADREQEASDAFPSDPGLTGAARASRVAVLIAKGEVGGEGMMP